MWENTPPRNALRDLTANQALCLKARFAAVLAHVRRWNRGCSNSFCDVAASSASDQAQQRRSERPHLLLTLRRLAKCCDQRVNLLFRVLLDRAYHWHRGGGFNLPACAFDVRHCCRNAHCACAQCRDCRETAVASASRARASGGRTHCLGNQRSGDRPKLLGIESERQRL